MKNFNLANIISLIIISLSIGWIVGNSISPVINTVVNSVMVLVATILTLLMGVDTKESVKSIDIKVHLLPFAIFCLFLALGGSLGVYSKENHWLGNEKGSKTQNPEKRANDSNDDIGFKNDETNFCNEINSHLEKPKYLLRLLKEYSVINKDIDIHFIESLNENDTLTIVNYAKFICKD